MLRRRGLGVAILSGDREAKVRRLAADLGLPPDAGVAGCTPEEKASWLERHGKHDALMLGDGANDSLAFDRALCRGTPVVHRGLLERKSDFFYLGRGIAGIRALFDINALRRRTQFAILAFSVAYNLAAVGLAVAGAMNPLVAAVLMPLSSLATLAIVTIGMRERRVSTA
jgi:Cu2+-exporting ATPase